MHAKRTPGTLSRTNMPGNYTKHGRVISYIAQWSSEGNWRLIAFESMATLSEIRRIPVPALWCVLRMPRSLYGRVNSFAMADFDTS